MKRRNPATASSPNPQFEMTSFMDIVFIFLFVVMVGYALKSAGVSDAADRKMTEAEEVLAEADQKLAEANDKLADLKVYEQQIEELSGAVVGSRVVIVTISCTYEAGDVSEREEWPRHLRVLGSDKRMILERDFKESTEKTAYGALRETLTKYVETIKKADREQLGDGYGENKQERTVIVFSVSREEGGILTRDYEEITGVIRDLGGAYDDVY